MPMLIDLHIHTSISPCSRMEVRDLICAAPSVGLDGICITDHDTMDVRHSIQEGFQDNGLLVLFGMEYATAQGDILIFGPFEDIPTGMDARTLLPLVRQSGGAAICAHPFRPARPTDTALLAEGLCTAMEVLNGRNRNSWNEQAKAYGQTVHLVETGGSDAHTIEEIGRFATNFTVPVTSRADLVNALNAGQCHPEVMIPTPQAASQDTCLTAHA